MPGVVVETYLRTWAPPVKAVSSVIDSTGHSVVLRRFDGFVSYPNYATATCGPVRVEPGQTVTCETPWVTPTAVPHHEGIVHRFVTLLEQTPLHITHVVPPP